MNSQTMQWCMEVLKENVYGELALAAGGFIVAIITAMLPQLPNRGFWFLFGLSLAVLGIALCFLSAVIYDRLYSQLRTVETAERKEQKREEKHSKKQKIKPVEVK